MTDLRIDDRMRVLYLHQYFRPPDGAGGIRSYLNARSWVADDVCVVVLTSNVGLPEDPDDRRRTLSSLRAEGVELNVVGPAYSSSMSTARRILAFLMFAVSATIWLIRKAHRFDVVYATSTPLTIAVPAMIARFRGLPWVLEVRDVWPEMPIAAGRLRSPFARRLAEFLERAAYASAESVVALSPGMRDSIVATSPSTEVTVVPNYSDVRPVESVRANLSPEVDSRIQLARDAGKTILSYVGSLNWLNGLDDVLELALADAADRFHFLVVGDGSERTRLIERARRMGLGEDNISFLPKVPYPEALAIFEASDLSLCLFRPIPEMEANSANKLFASLSVGTPVAINYGGWQSELLAGPAGLRLDTANAPTACEQLEGFLSSHVHAERRSASLALARAFSPSKGAATILAALRRAARGRTSPAQDRASSLPSH